MELHIFNPENDLALADGGAAYCPPPAATRIAYDLASLPLWFANSGDAVLLPDIVHAEFHKEISSLFQVAGVYESVCMERVTGCRPWGWSPQIKRRLKAMGVKETLLPADSSIADMRMLSNRQSAIRILAALHKAGVDTPEIPLYLTEASDVAAFINSMPRSVIKAPWSGSGKGIAWGIGRVETPVEHFYKGVIRRQGGVVCEHFLDSVQEFAMEFKRDASGVKFVGYSLFEAVKGSYSGNILADDSKLESILAKYIPVQLIDDVKCRVAALLDELLSCSAYNGYIGVDMMIYRDGSRLRLNPCMELNLRCNMGVVSRIFHDRYVAPGKEGRYAVSFYAGKKEAMEVHAALKAQHPLLVEDGRVVSGYLNLSPVTEETRYMAYVVI